MATLAPGHRCSTASAMTCAVEWRSTGSASSSRSVRMRTRSPSSSGSRRSRSSPFTSTAAAADASRGPLAAAASRPAAPSANASRVPSGSSICMARSISTGAGTLTPMDVVAVALALLAGVLGAALFRRDRERRAALSVLGWDGSGLVSAARRSAQSRVPREELSAVLALRDALMAASPYPVLVFDPSAHLVRANPAARRLLPLLVTGEPPQPAALATAVRDALAGRTARTVELTVYEPDRRRYVAHLQPFAGRDGRGCAVVFGEQSAEADFRDARSLFSAGVSHELRTPLARMLALVAPPSLPVDEPEREQLHDQMRDEIDGMRRLIEEMVLLVRLETGEPAGQRERCDITAAVEGCVERQAERAERAGVTLAGDSTGGLVAAIAPPLVDVI